MPRRDGPLPTEPFQVTEPPRCAASSLSLTERRLEVARGTQIRAEGVDPCCPRTQGKRGRQRCRRKPRKPQKGAEAVGAGARHHRWGYFRTRSRSNRDSASARPFSPEASHFTSKAKRFSNARRK